MRHAAFVAVLAFTVSLGLLACGGKKDGGGGAKPPKPADGTPVVVEFVKIVGSGKDMKASFKVHNYEAKVITGMQMRLHYQDEAGKELKSFPWGVVKPEIVGKNGSGSIEAGAFMPPETKKVAVTVREVQFKDGSKWQQKEEGAAPSGGAAAPAPAPAEPAADGE